MEQAGSLDAPVASCPECGWRRGEAIRTRTSWLSLWRWVPALAVLGLIAWQLWMHRSAPRTHTSHASSPAILDSPCLPRATVEAIAQENADAAAVESFTKAIGDACRRGMPFQARALDERASFVSVGFVATGTTLREDFLIGWPVAYLWGVRQRAMTDSIAHEPASSPDDKPFIWFPPWPALSGHWEHYGYLGRYSTNVGGWEVNPYELRFEEAGPAQPQRNGSWRSDSERVVAVKLDALSIPLAALWVTWIVAGLFVRRWRRLLLVCSIAAAVALAFWLNPSIRQLQPRGWSPAPAASNQIWKDLRPLGLRARDVLGMLESDAERRSLAERILEVAPSDEGRAPHYLVVSIGPTWQQDLTQQTFTEPVRVLWFSSTSDAKYIPPEIAAMPRDGRFAVSLAYTDLVVTLKSATPSTENLSLRFHLGWVCWIGLATAIAWSFPARIVGCLRARRTKRRAARGLCPKCAYQLASGSSTESRS